MLELHTKFEAKNNKMQSTGFLKPFYRLKMSRNPRVLLLSPTFHHLIFKVESCLSFKLIKEFQIPKYL